MKVDVIGPKKKESPYFNMRDLVPGTIIRYGSRHLVILQKDGDSKETEENCVYCLVVENETVPRLWIYPSETSIHESDIRGTVQQMTLIVNS